MIIHHVVADAVEAMTLAHRRAAHQAVAQILMSLVQGADVSVPQIQIRLPRHLNPHARVVEVQNLQIAVVQHLRVKEVLVQVVVQVVALHQAHPHGVNV